VFALSCVTPEESQTLQDDLTARRLKKELQSQNPCPDPVLAASNSQFRWGFSDLDKSPVKLQISFSISLSEG
jgi:hypothetical protein